MRYRAISFDAGFTLIEPAQNVFEVVRAALGRAGIGFAEAAFEVGARAAQQLFFASYEIHGNTDWTDDRSIQSVWERYYGVLFDALELPSASRRTLIDEINRRYNDPGNWRLYPEVRAVLADLRARGYPLVIVSDWDSGLPALLGHLKVFDLLDNVLASGAVGLAKPQAAFYRMASQRAGAPPEEMIHVGDSYFADVSGARAAGMDGVLLDREGLNPPVDCPIVRDLRGFVALVEEANSGAAR